MSLVETQGGRATPLPKSMVQRAVEGVRYVISGVTPQTWFGPSQPLPPMAPAETAGRAFDYPFGANLQYTPRSYEPIGFADLRAMADNCDIVRLLIETRKDQVEAQDYDIRPRKLSTGEHPKASEFATQIAAAKDFFAFPDKDHDFAQWTRMLGEDLFVIDAPTLYRRLDRKGRIYAFEVVDGATIAPRIDANGRTPMSPDVAYQQILHGVPATDYSTDDLIYYPRNKRPNKVYGYSPVEQIVLTINVIMRRMMHQLAYYTEGNLTDAMFTAPKEWSKDQIEAWQKYWNSLFAGNLMARRQGVWVPNGTDVKQPKQPILKDPFDELILRVASFAFSISPQWAVAQQNRATAETAKEQATEEGLAPILNWYKRLNDRVLRSLGYPQLEFIWNEDREIDPQVAATIDQNDAAKGLRSINSVRVSRGWDPDPNPAADTLMVLTPTGYVPIGAALTPPATVTDPNAPPPPKPKPETTDDAETGADAGKVEKAAKVRRVGSTSVNKPVLRAARAAIAKRYASALDQAKAVAVKSVRGAVKKADDDPRVRINKAIDGADFSSLEDAANDSADDMAAAAADSGKTAVLQLGLDGDDDMFDAINARAVKWAGDESADLVTSIDDTTRDRLKALIAKGLEDGLTADDIADQIEADDSELFSDARADLIAKTEIGDANSAGALAGYKEAAASGVKVKKVWLLGEHACDVCQDNADAGAIDLDDTFPSGDDAPLAHPSCECALGSEVSDDGDN